MSLNSFRLLLSDGLLIVFLVLLFFGILGMFRFKTSFGRILNSSKIDSVAAIALMCALMLRANNLSVLFKLMAILIFYVLTNPVTTQLVAYAAKKHAADQAQLEREGLK